MGPKDYSFCGVQDEKTMLQIKTPNVNSNWRTALLMLPAHAEIGEYDRMTACFNYAVCNVLVLTAQWIWMTQLNEIQI